MEGVARRKIMPAIERYRDGGRPGRRPCMAKPPKHYVASLALVCRTFSAISRLRALGFTRHCPQKGRAMIERTIGR